MYAGYVSFKLGPGMRTMGEKLADQFAPAFKAAKGCTGVTFFADWETGEYQTLSLWQAKEDHDAFVASARPQLEQAVAGIVKEPPFMKLFEVYEPKS